MAKRKGANRIGKKRHIWLRSKRGRQYLMEKIKYKEPLDPAETCFVLGKELEKRSRSRFRSGKNWNHTHFRMSVREFNHLRNESAEATVDEHYRNKLTEAGLNAELVVGIGHNVVVITHDD